MTKLLSCREVGCDCDYIVTGETEEAIATSMATAIVVVSLAYSAAAAANTCSGSGFNRADCNVHENTGGVGSNQDLNFHIGTCQGGHSSTVLDTIGGCSGLHDLVGAQTPSQFHSNGHSNH